MDILWRWVWSGLIWSDQIRSGLVALVSFGEIFALFDHFGILTNKQRTPNKMVLTTNKKVVFCKNISRGVNEAIEKLSTVPNTQPQY